MTTIQEAADRHLAEHDTIVGEIINLIKLPEIHSTRHLFHDLMSCVIEQQIHYRSSKKQFAKLLLAADIHLLTPDNFEFFEEKALLRTKLSARKYETMAAVLEFFHDNEPDWVQMDDAAVSSTLGGIQGVGKWTVDMLLIYTLGRADVFTADDYHLQQIMSRLYGLEQQGLKAAMKGIAEHWKPYRSFGLRYLLAWKEAEKRKK